MRFATMIKSESGHRTHAFDPAIIVEIAEQLFETGLGDLACAFGIAISGKICIIEMGEPGVAIGDGDAVGVRFDKGP